MLAYICNRHTFNMTFLEISVRLNFVGVPTLNQKNMHYLAEYKNFEEIDTRRISLKGTNFDQRECSVSETVKELRKLTTVFPCPDV